jgi:hypothetical protein
MLMVQSDRVPRTRHPDRLQHTSVPELLGRTLAHHQKRFRRVVGLDAPDIVGVGLLHVFDERAELLLELLADRLLLGTALVASFSSGAIQVLALLNGVCVSDQLAGSSLEKRLGSQGDLVLVLLHEVGLGRVLNETREVPDAKDCLGFLDVGGMEPGVVRHSLVLFGNVLLVHAVCPVPVASLGETALVVEHGQDPHLGSLDGIETILIVWKFDEGPLDRLGLVLGLLELEYELVELLLEGLVGIVDAELLERIDSKAFEPENVQYAAT